MTPKSSTESEPNLSLSSPSSPTKIAPPVPPKPKSSNKESPETPGNEIYLNKDELIEQLSRSPSYEDTFENQHPKPTEREPDLCPDISLERESPNNNSSPVTRNTSRVSHKEFFNLPFESNAR